MKQALAYVPPFWMVALRFGLSIPFLGLAIVLSQRRLPKFHRADAPVVFGVGLLQFAGQMTLVTLALQTVNASTATLLIYSTPVWLLMIDLIIARNKVSLGRMGLVALSLAGCIFIVWQGADGAAGLGYAQIILAAVFWSISIRLIGSHRWKGAVLDALFWQALLATSICTPTALLFEGALDMTVLDAPALWYLLYVGPLATAGGFGLMVFAGRHVAPPLVALSSTAAPLIGVATAAAILGETLSSAIWIGGGLMLLSLFLGAGPLSALRKFRSARHASQD